MNLRENIVHPDFAARFKASSISKKTYKTIIQIKRALS
jgi:hypothetical protein